MTAQHGKRRYHVRHEGEEALALGSEAACSVAAKSLALRAEEMRRRKCGVAMVVYRVLWRATSCRFFGNGLLELRTFE